ncbi:MAG: FAD-dependent oxidoreductase [Sedimentisphaerales bacterium]|nr:FAD-dependent oxidoreductase [Sedimentisphaerales bacterium]
MKGRMTRREYLRMMGASGFGISTGLLVNKQLLAQDTGKNAGSVADKQQLTRGIGESGFQSSVITADKIKENLSCATLVDGKVIQPRRQLPILTETDVLVVGGGSAGITAAIAAARAGAKVTIIERYGHFGGLWTGGLVLVILGHIAKGPKQVCQGIGEEIMRRLDKMNGAIINRGPGLNPTVDAEAVKYLMVEMIEQAAVQVFLHCWAVDAIVQGSSVRGAVFESKSGRQAIIAKVVIDATGDGDIFAAAGAQFEHRSHNVGLVSRIGNLDLVDKTKTPDTEKPKRLGGVTPVPGVNWVNMTGPEVDGLDITTMTRLEMNHRKYIWKKMQKVRDVPGYDKVYLMETAPQLGVRITRILNGLETVKVDDIKNSTQYPDVIGVGGASNAEHAEWQIPYGALVPRTVDNVLAAGRCISCDMRMADLVRLIPNCFVTGQAAGVAAAVAVRDRCKPRDADITEIQKILRQQEAYLG